MTLLSLLLGFLLLWTQAAAPAAPQLPQAGYISDDPRVLWPDTLSLATNGYLYFTVNQLHRQPIFHQGQDLRQKPYALFRIKVDAVPVLLK